MGDGDFIYSDIEQNRAHEPMLFKRINGFLQDCCKHLLIIYQ